MLLIVAAHSSQGSCNSLSISLSFLFGIRVELEFNRFQYGKISLLFLLICLPLERSEQLLEAPGKCNLSSNGLRALHCHALSLHQISIRIQ